MGNKSKRREVPVPLPEPPAAPPPMISGLSQDEIKMILGDNVILITQLVKENQRLSFIVQTLRNRIAELEAPPKE